MPAAVDALLQPKVAAALKELTDVLEDLPVFVWPGKSHDQPDLKIMQVMLNAVADEWLREMGWMRQVPLHKLSTYAHRGDRTVDFALEVEGGKFLVVEAQFANASRTGDDLSKLTTLHQHGVLSLGVLVNLTKATSVMADSGIANVADSLNKADNRLLPLCILGLGHENTPELDLSVIPGLVLPTILGGKGGPGSGQLRQYIASQLLNGRLPSQIKLPQLLIDLVRKQELAYFKKLNKGLDRNVALALHTGNSDAIDGMLAALLANVALIKGRHAPACSTDYLAGLTGEGSVTAETLHLGSGEFTCQQSPLFA